MDLVLEALYIVNRGYNIIEKLVYFSNQRYVNNDFKIYDWLEYAKKSKIPSELWRQFYSKLMTNISITKHDNCEIIIGPVDRTGNKTHNAISSKYEGVFIRLLLLMSFLYPNLIRYKTELKFKVDQNVNMSHMMNTLIELSRSNNKKVISDNKTTKIMTKLWNHQEETVNKLYNGYINDKKLGYGDASHVGAGKTLTALSLMSKLNNVNKEEMKYSGFLVMVPTDKLFDTWKTEIEKHTENFDVLFQLSNGKLSGKSTGKSTGKSHINNNTIIISTMGRMRDKPLSHPWFLVIIDECLTVQNKETAHTEEAWRQVITSKYGVLMMSATFFRSRFDKLYYMLKMLRTGLPENQEYLDTILCETMICKITETRNWLTNITKFKLTDKQRNEYDKLLDISDDHEKTYLLLQKYINENCNYVNFFNEKVVELELKNLHSDCKILIYAKSKNEADNIALYKNISRYPDLSKKHVVVSYSEGTYGLNNLIGYDTIVTRIPEPDKIPQMKGRLDRPGQMKDILNLEYIMIENTIDDGMLYKLEMANTFKNVHLLPLAEFYKIALKK